jgi:hypothetical protein
VNLFSRKRFLSDPPPDPYVRYSPENAEKLYAAGLITTNHARWCVGSEPLSGTVGDEYFSPWPQAGQ